MPTCSQAKIISNLEVDINKRVYNLVNQEQELTSVSRLPPPAYNHNINNNVITHPTTTRILEEPRYLLRQRANTEYFQNNNNSSTKFAGVSRRSLAKQLHQFSNDEFTISNYNLQLSRRLPAINNVFGTRKDSVPINFLFNSNIRNKSGGISHRYSSTKLLHKNYSPTDNDEDNEATSDVNSSWSSGSENMATTHHIPEKSGENSHRENIQPYEYIKKLSNSMYSSLPKLALEIEQITDSSSENTNSNEEDSQRGSKKFSITAAKRLLALASIRPSKTFHKEITIEEAEILKKYYDIIKPKVHINLPTAENEDDESDRVRNIEIPILYDSAKINYDTFSSLEMFLTEYKAELTSGKYHIEHNLPGFNGFVLKHAESDHIIQFPPHVHDTFVAFTMSLNAKGNPNLDENHILKSIHWNDTRHILAPKQTGGRKGSRNSIDIVKTKGVPTVNLEAVKEMSRLVRTILEPKILKKVIDNGIDLSALPGGMNFEMPPPTNEYELSHDPSKIESQIAATLGGAATNGKLKNVTYKKLKEKVTTTKVMWFSAPPVFKPLSVVFEYAGFDLTHETILEDVNKCLESTGTGGQVVEIEFVPRSVQFGSVHVQNLWILTLSDKDAKFYTISHGIEINGQKVIPKSYDDYIYTEYEKYIRTEKYKQMIKLHEKIMSKTSMTNNNQK